jgi:tRNA dimethylallyltransferase
LIYDFNIPKVPADKELRSQLEKQAEEYGNEHVYKRLVELDPEYAKEIHPNNLKYVIRALEIKMLTGKSKTEFREEKALKYDVLFLNPYNGNREELYDKINARVGQMFSDGLVNEVKSLLEKGYKKTDF